jgi:hypothetical protein
MPTENRRVTAVQPSRIGINHPIYWVTGQIRPQGDQTMSDSKLAIPSKENLLENTISGWVMLVVLLVMFLGGIVMMRVPLIGAPLVVLAVFLSVGFLVLKPNESAVLTLFGRYIGTVRREGFHWVNPFYAKQKVSLRVRNFTTLTLKVNDKVGNPIDVAAERHSPSGVRCG